MAVKCFKVLENRFHKNPEYFQIYKKQIDDYIKLGHTKLLTMCLQKISNKTNYIPHHDVVNVNKPGIVQVVFNASAKNDNILNDKLLAGINYLNSLVGVLTKFRHGKYTIMRDIEKMFLRVKVKEKDLNALHFVWRDSDQDEISDYMLCHLFGKKDSPCITNWSLKQSIKNEAEIIQQTVDKKFYMDNFLNSLSNEKNLIRITSKIIIVLNTYGFQLNLYQTHQEC